MDKAKFAWPQYPWERVNKDMDSFHRPRLVLTAAIAHGFGTFIFIVDDQSVNLYVTEPPSAAFKKLLLDALYQILKPVSILNSLRVL